MMKRRFNAFFYFNLNIIDNKHDRHTTDTTLQDE